MNRLVPDPAFWSRVQFGFTLTYHYLFPPLGAHGATYLTLKTEGPVHN